MKNLNDLNLNVQLDKQTYKKKLKQLQYEMLNAQQYLFNNQIGLILVFEGMDAAGKGGAIKRLTARLTAWFCSTSYFRPSTARITLSLFTTFLA